MLKWRSVTKRRPGAGVPYTEARMLGKSAGKDSAIAPARGGSPPEGSEPPENVEKGELSPSSGGGTKSRRPSRSGPAIVKVNRPGRTSPRLSVQRPDPATQVTSSP